MKPQSRHELAKLRKIRAGLAVLFLAVLAWALLQLSLPFGNQLVALIGVTEGARKELGFIERLVASQRLSEWVIHFRGYSCDASMLVFDYKPLGYDAYPSDAIGRAILMYETVRQELKPHDNRRIRSLIGNLIEHCDPNLGLRGRPPIVDAIFAEEKEFVQALLDRGADPLLKYVAGTGATVTPLRAAERLAEVEAERLQEDPNHPLATGKAQRILDLIRAHIAENS